MIGILSTNKQSKFIRACVLIDSWKPIWGGGQTHVWETNKRLIKMYNFAIDIYTRNLIDNDISILPSKELLFWHKLTIFRVGSKGKFHNFFLRILWLFQVMISVILQHKKHHYDLIHAHAYTSAIPAKILSWILHIPVIFTVHGCNNLDLKVNKLAYQIEKFLLTQIRFDQEISVSQHFLKYKNINKNIEVIPNGVDVSLFDNISKNNKDKSHFDILWVGRFDLVKGIDILLKAFAKITKKFPKCRLVLVSNSNLKAYYQQLINYLNIENKIKFYYQSSFPELIRIFKSADIFVLPSLSEGMPISILEAWAAKLPVIATEVGDIPKLVKNDSNGYIIEPNNIIQLTKAIIKVINHPHRHQLGLVGYRLVKHRYSWDESVRRLAKIYYKL